MYKVDFASLPLDEGRPDVRIKTYQHGGRRLRLVEFATDDANPCWCESGHIGYVLAGRLTIAFGETLVDFKAGDGLFIPPGSAHAHRGTTIAAGTQLLMVEDVEDCPAEDGQNARSA